MIPSSIRKLTSRVAPLREFSRRAVDSEHYQPQDQDLDNDSSTATRGTLSEIILRRRRLLAGEPEDARLTGGTRSLMRRLTGLNVRPERSMIPITHLSTAKTPQVA